MMEVRGGFGKSAHIISLSLSLFPCCICLGVVVVWWNMHKTPSGKRNILFPFLLPFPHPKKSFFLDKLVRVLDFFFFFFTYQKNTSGCFL